MRTERVQHNPRRRQIAALLLLTIPLFAHDSVFPHSSRTLHLSLSPDTLTIEYRLRLPFDQAWVELASMDTDGDREVSASEKRSYLERKALRLLQKLTLSSSGKSLGLNLTDVALDSGITQTFTFRAAATAPCTLRDTNFSDLPGTLRIHSDAQTTVLLPDQPDPNHIEDIVLSISRSEKN